MINVWNSHVLGLCIIWFNTHYRCLGALGTRILYECPIYSAFICGWRDFSYFKVIFCFYLSEACRILFPGSLNSLPKIHWAIDVSSVFPRKCWACWNVVISGSISYLEFLLFFLWLPLFTFLLRGLGALVIQSRDLDYIPSLSLC